MLNDSKVGDLVWVMGIDATPVQAKVSSVFSRTLILKFGELTDSFPKEICFSTLDSLAESFKLRAVYYDLKE